MKNFIKDNEKAITLPETVIFTDNGQEYEVHSSEVKLKPIYLDGDIIALNLYAEIENYGTVGSHIAEFKDNAPHYFEPHLQSGFGVVEPEEGDDDFEECGDYDDYDCDTEMSLSDETTQRIHIEWFDNDD